MSSLGSWGTLWWPSALSPRLCRIWSKQGVKKHVAWWTKTNQRPKNGLLKFLQQNKSKHFSFLVWYLGILTTDAYCECSIWDNKLNGLWMSYILLDKVEKYSSSHLNIAMDIQTQTHFPFFFLASSCGSSSQSFFHFASKVCFKYKHLRMVMTCKNHCKISLQKFCLNSSLLIERLKTS